MIISKEVEVRVNNKNINHFHKQGLFLKYGEITFVPINYLPKYSKYKILVRCESCFNESEISMQKYSKNKDRSGTYNCKSCNNITFRKSMINKYGVDNPSKNEDSNEKRKQTCLKLYGTEYVVGSDYTHNRRREVLIEKYGFDHPMKIDEIKYRASKNRIFSCIENGSIIKDEDLSKWNLYRRNVRRLTERNRETLLKYWDGTDYYDGEYIKENFKYKHTDLLFPSLDHKISIIYGFMNNIPPEEISDISNLCLTKKINNSSKGRLTEEQFKRKMEV